jgi:hypothetical protein
MNTDNVGDFVRKDFPLLIKYAERIWPGRKIVFGYFPVFSSTQVPVYVVGPAQDDPRNGPSPAHAAASPGALLEVLRNKVLDALVGDSLLKEGQ